jgi:hypothetical protein
MRLICGVYIGWMAVMIVIGDAGDIMRSPALLQIAQVMGLLTPVVILGVVVALLVASIREKTDADRF